MNIDYKKVNKETYDKISKDWDKKRSYVWKPVSNFLNKQNNRDRIKLLDLGGGGGRHMEYALKIGYLKKNIYGCDISLGQVNVMKSKGFNALVCDMENLSYKDNFFDNIICIAVLHHLFEKNEHFNALKEIYRVLKNKGKCLLSVWFPENDFLNKQLEKGKFIYLDDEKRVEVSYTDVSSGYRKAYKRYYYLFEENELINLCKDVGFNVLDVIYDKGNLYVNIQKEV